MGVVTHCPESISVARSLSLMSAPLVLGNAVESNLLKLAFSNFVSSVGHSKVRCTTSIFILGGMSSLFMSVSLPSEQNCLRFDGTAVAKVRQLVCFELDRQFC